MAMRYTKCHSLPYPCYGLAGSSTVANTADLTWTNGPPGGYSAVTAHVEYAAIASTAATTVVTTLGTNQTLKVSGITNVGPTDFRFRIRRQNAEGYGDWSSYVTVNVL